MRKVIIIAFVTTLLFLGFIFIVELKEKQRDNLRIANKICPIDSKLIKKTEEYVGFYITWYWPINKSDSIFAGKQVESNRLFFLFRKITAESDYYYFTLDKTILSVRKICVWSDSYKIGIDTVFYNAEEIEFTGKDTIISNCTKYSKSELECLINSYWQDR